MEARLYIFIVSGEVWSVAGRSISFQASRNFSRRERLEFGVMHNDALISFSKAILEFSEERVETGRSFTATTKPRTISNGPVHLAESPLAQKGLDFKCLSIRSAKSFADRYRGHIGAILQCPRSTLSSHELGLCGSAGWPTLWATNKIGCPTLRGVRRVGTTDLRGDVGAEI